MAFIHESDSSILRGYTTVVGLVGLQCQRTRSVAVLVPFSGEISRAIGELQLLAGLRIVCWHEHAITVDGGVTQVGTHDLLDLIDVFHADQQCGRSWVPSAFSKVTETAGAYNVSDTPLMSDTSLTICWLMSSPMATMSTL